MCCYDIKLAAREPSSVTGFRKDQAFVQCDLQSVLFFLSKMTRKTSNICLWDFWIGVSALHSFQLNTQLLESYPVLS